MTTRLPLESATVISGIEDTVRSLAWSLDGNWLYIGTDAKGLAAYDVRLSQLGPFVGDGSQIQSLAVSPDGNTVAAGLANDGSIRLLSAETGELEMTIWPAHTNWVQVLAFSPDGKVLASAGDDGAVILWDPTTGEQERKLLEDHGATKALVFTPDGRQLIAAPQFEETFYEWDTRTWELKRTFPGDLAEDLAIAPDGARMVTAGGGIHEANLWSVKTGSLLFNLREMPGWVWAVAYAPDGKNVAAGGIGHVVVLWDTQTGLPSRELYTGGDFIQSLAYSPDGTMLAVGGSEGVTVWHVTQP
jgi:Tol biopolymer transport system component